VLQELANGTLVGRGWSAPEVSESLDLCLACKACSSDCPAGVDVATYKAEVLHRRYRRRLRPRTHYVLGWLPRWARLVTAVPGLAWLANAVLGVRPIARLVLRAGGMDPRRSMVTFARTPFRTWARGAGHDEVTVATSPPPAASLPAASASAAAPPLADGPGARRPPVLLWTDSFNDTLSPDVARAAVAVLRDAGYEVLVPDHAACCGLTWITTGQLDGAKDRLRHLLGVLAPFAVNGVPIVGLEPSCTAVLRSDLLDLLPDDPRATAVARATRTLAELLTAPAPVGPGGRWSVPDLSDVTAVVQPHCHHHSVMGFGADRELLASAGATVIEASGCCGMAGMWGTTADHYDVAVAVANTSLLPALANAPTGSIYLADGYSCRTQADDLAGVTGRHLAQLLAERAAR